LINGVLIGLGLSAAAGLNAWAVLLLFQALELVVPQEFAGPSVAFLSSRTVLTVALVLFLAEFIADKIPIVDHVWNLAQTVLRPAVGALLALSVVADPSPAARVGLAAAGAAATLLTHIVKTTTRLTSTAATRGLAQLAVSLAEDLIAVTLGALVFFVPWFSWIILGGLVLLLAVERRRVARGLAVMFFRLKHPRRARPA
jgi:hypothetical protein